MTRETSQDVAAIAGKLLGMEALPVFGSRRESEAFMAMVHSVAASALAQREPETVVPVSIGEIAVRGMDERLEEVLGLLIGEVLPQAARGAVTLEEMQALGYGPPCECGERGLRPGEASCTECEAEDGAA